MNIVTIQNTNFYNYVTQAMLWFTLVLPKIRATKLAHFLVVYIRAVSVEKRNSVCTNRSQYLSIRHMLYSCDLLFAECEKPRLVVLAFMSTCETAPHTAETAPHTNMCFRFA